MSFNAFTFDPVSQIVDRNISTDCCPTSIPFIKRCLKHNVLVRRRGYKKGHEQSTSQAKQIKFVLDIQIWPLFRRKQTNNHTFTHQINFEFDTWKLWFHTWRFKYSSRPRVTNCRAWIHATNDIIWYFFLAMLLFWKKCI